MHCGDLFPFALKNESVDMTLTKAVTFCYDIILLSYIIAS